MASPLTLENRLLLACARTEPDVPRLQELVERGPDWQEILRKTERWGLASLVYTNLRQAAQAGHMPQPVAERLRHFYRRDTVHKVVRRELLRATLLRFAAARIPVIVLKGAALATLMYPSPGLRPTGGIDLLVHRRDQERVEAVLRSLRDVAEEAAPSGSPPLDPERLVLLDIRQDVFSARSVADGLPAAGCIPIEDFWERARPAQIESVATLVFSPEDLLLYLAFHLTEETDFVGQVRTLCDVGEVCRCYRGEIEWRQLVARARSYNIAKPLYYALRLAHELVGADVPSRALAELRASFGQLPLEDRFMAAVTRRAILSEDHPTGLRWSFYRLGVHLLATRRARDGAMRTWRLLAHGCQVRLRRLGVRVAASCARLTGAASAAPSLAARPSDGSDHSQSVAPQVTFHEEFPGAFDWDSYIYEEFKRLIQKWNIRTCIETGTNLGRTTKALASLVDRVFTCEISDVFYDQATKNLADLIMQTKVIVKMQTSPVFLHELLPHLDDRHVMFYLDAHWQKENPLQSELNAIALNFRNRAIIAIHDFQVPNRDFGYDSYPDQEYNFVSIEPYLKNIYPDGFEYHYNHKAEGGGRGIIYIESKESRKTMNMLNTIFRKVRFNSKTNPTI